VIKSEVTVTLSAGEQAQADQIAELISAAGFLPVQEQTVHPQTLRALVREQLAAGNPIPLELFGARVVTQAHLDRPRSRAAV